MAPISIRLACLIPGAGSPSVNGSVFGLFLFLFFFGSTWLRLPYLYPAEINPLRTRTNANAVSTISNWLFNFAVVQFTPPFLQASSWGCFLFFVCWNALFILVICSSPFLFPARTPPTTSTAAATTPAPVPLLVPPDIARQSQPTTAWLSGKPSIAAADEFAAVSELE
ncbi:hypothetical protein JCM10207_001420 [Rhodosporidiobolus poonsookiae]